MCRRYIGVPAELGACRARLLIRQACCEHVAAVQYATGSTQMEAEADLKLPMGAVECSRSVSFTTESSTSSLVKSAVSQNLSPT